jgi:hypothetical protein
MDDDHPFLEKQIGHKPYGKVPRFGRIAIWLVCIAVACGLVLYLALWAIARRQAASMAFRQLFKLPLPWREFSTQQIA